MKFIFDPVGLLNTMHKTTPQAQSTHRTVNSSHANLGKVALTTNVLHADLNRQTLTRKDYRIGTARYATSAK